MNEMTKIRDAEQAYMSSSAVGVHIESVSKRFGELTVLSDVSLEIEPGSFHILIGPSGCGKTTLLRMIGGLESPSVGQISFFSAHDEYPHLDEPLSEIDLPKGRALNARELSYGFQEPRLLPWRTVKANVALPLELAGEAPEMIEPKVKNLLEKVGLTHAAELYPNQLSGGMKMRAAIARALVTEPKILLLDEPFGALDEITKNRLDDELLELWRQLDMTVVLVTHSLSEAVYLGGSIHVLAPNPGVILETLKIDFPKRSPQLRLTAAFTEQVAEAHHHLMRAEGVE